jgi:hypothetical protein
MHKIFRVLSRLEALTERLKTGGYGLKRIRRELVPTKLLTKHHETTQGFVIVAPVSAKSLVFRVTMAS